MWRIGLQAQCRELGTDPAVDTGIMVWPRVAKENGKWVETKKRVKKKAFTFSTPPQIIFTVVPAKLYLK